MSETNHGALKTLGRATWNGANAALCRMKASSLGWHTGLAGLLQTGETLQQG